MSIQVRLMRLAAQSLVLSLALTFIVATRPAAASTPARSMARIHATSSVQRGVSIVAATSRPHREVLGFVNAGNLANPSVGYQSWNFGDLSTVVLFGLHVLSDGSISPDNSWNVWNSSTFSSLLSTAHANGVKVVPSIIFHDFSSTNGGNSWTPMCEVLLSSATSHTVADVASEVKAKGADGFNMDYEGNNQLCPNGQYQAAMLVSLMQQLRSALPGYYISIDTYNGSYYSGYYFDIPSLNPYVDSFFLMDYDSTWSNYSAEPMHCSVYCFSPNAPLIRYNYNDTDSVHGYLGLVPASKIILGVPYYGNTACIPGSSRPGPNAVPYTDDRAHWSVPRYIDSATTNGQPSVSQFATANDPYSPSDVYSTWYDSEWACWRESYWDNTSSLAAKYDLVNSNNLRGVGVFTLDYGGGMPELWNLIHAKFAGCSSPTLTANPASPQTVGSTVAFTATSAGCSSPLYEFWIQTQSGSWDDVQPYSSSPTYNWYTSGLAAGTYNLIVWVKQSGNTNDYDTYASTAFTFNACAAIAMTSSLASPQPLGTALAFGASPSLCPDRLYSFWYLPPGGPWVQAQGYSSSSNWNWNTNGLRAGNYTIVAWSKLKGSSTATYDSYVSMPFALTGCSSTNLSGNIASPAALGSTISFTATASGCSSPLYSFWYLPPTGSWVQAQAYSSSSNWSWNTTGLRPGSYTIVAWVKQAGSGTPTYDSFASAVYSLAGCSAVSMTVTPTAAAVVGSTVSASATATSCPNPLYSFWYLPPGGSWTQAQGYSASGSWTWNTTGLRSGSYTLVVWAKQQGSGTSTYDSFATTSYMLQGSCTSVTMTGSPASAASRGTTVSFSASASGCPNPLYSYWIKPPGGAWQQMTPYSSSGSWSWNTTGYIPGTYTVVVWAKQQGSQTSTYETFASQSFTLS